MSCPKKSSYGCLIINITSTSRNPSNPIIDWCQDSWGRISFLPQSFPLKIIITYLIRVFDATWESEFWALKFLFIGQFLFFHVDLKTITDVSMEVLEKRPRKVKERHLSQNTKDLLVERGRFKRMDPASDVNRSAYSKLNKLVRKSSKIDDSNWAIRVATDLEEASKKGQHATTGSLG